MMVQSDMTFEKVLSRIMVYIKNEESINMIKKAYNLAKLKHENQVRKSGEPYIIHPLEVTYILAELNAGPSTLVAGLLHDVVEDTDTTLQDLKTIFNDDVASIVDGLTKIKNLKFNTTDMQTENHQKMLLAMAKDIRVIIVKLADRLHNIRTLDAMPQEKQYRIAKETLDIYAPLAHRLGMFRIKAELEDRSLRYTDFEMYQTITQLIRSKRAERESYIERMIDTINGLFADTNFTEYQIKGRIKNIYSIYKKMVNNHKEFSEIYDLLAIRIIVNKVEDCYHALGIIHANFVPLPKRFKDYIAVPKPNMYQSLHTTVIGNDGEMFEIQIRTQEMDKVAEYGIAAHWAYKENKEYSKEREQFEIAEKLKWYGDLMRLSQDDETVNNAEEFVDTIKGDILDANIYVFTPKSEVIALPKGSTPLDFAYRIHSDIGNKTVGAIVNNKIVPLDYELKTGDILSIKTNKNSFGPNEDWIKICKTAHAKNKIRSFLNKQNRDKLILAGKENLDRELSTVKEDYELNDSFVKNFFSKNTNINNLEDLYVEIGKGIISARTVVNKLLGNEVDKDLYLQKQIEKSNRILTTNSESGVVVEGLTNPQIRLGNCCNPIPGDNIVGYVSKGNGIIVHTENCNNLQTLEHERFIKVLWATNPNRKFPCRIKITASNTNNVFANIINTINSSNLQIASVNAVNNNNLEMIVKLKLLTTNTDELEKLIINLQKIHEVYQIERDNK